uniref:DUF4116 domain-containing protein n=1 Tax=Gongylonema pulchrum TaxID=637853 RepID=A0A183D6G6_9BILA
LLLGAGIWCLLETSDYCPYYSALWTSAVLLVNAVLGVAAARRGTVNLFVAHLVLSLISLMLCAAAAAISARNWLLIGTYEHPRIKRNEAFCVVGEHDAARLQYMFSQLNRYDFQHCMYQLKVGVSVNTLQLALVVVQGPFLCTSDHVLRRRDSAYYEGLKNSILYKNTKASQCFNYLWKA